ncbi:DNA end-binding protein Ku [Bryocella elongata]|uniref:Non-homologous end joining protein Ku n=1 Tax=Bryocella elongata TaxID=863522 RepID=A0A1H5ST19_9BACT|nr:Ku protein [Bryocella elongata]SEF53655.1 DNA end-binding protein Ku [Bryocella elongata]
MARPYWSGQIQISLVSFGVKLFVATEARSDIHFHEIDRRTGERVRHQKVLASALDRHPEEAADQDEVVERPQIVKGYEYSKGRYVTIEPDELANLRVPSKHAMEVARFVDAADIPPEFYEKPYFVVPENASSTEAFVTVRKALIDARKVALSKVAFSGREHIVAIAPAGTDAHPGMMAYTLRYDAELRNAATYFDEVKKTPVNADSLALAKELIKRRSGSFEPESFVDGYEAAVKELVEAKLQHIPVPRDEAPATSRGKVINLMDALRKSVSGDSGVENEAKPHRQKPEPAARESRTRTVKSPNKGLALVKGSGRTGKAATKAVRRRKTA